MPAAASLAWTMGGRGQKNPVSNLFLINYSFKEGVKVNRKT